MIGFALYEAIFNGGNDLEDDLREKIVDAYLMFMDLAVDATRYYKDGTRCKLFCLCFDLKDV